jgi:hypothetical protein
LPSTFFEPELQLEALAHHAGKKTAHPSAGCQPVAFIIASIVALAHSSYPKLLFAGNPGALVSPTFAESFAKGLKNCRVVQLGSGIHYLQEDNAEVIGATVNEWLIGSSPKHKVAS